MTDPIDFTTDQRATLVDKLQTYFEAELDRELGRFEAEFLLEFLAKNIGPHFYNQGVRDAEKQLRLRMESLVEAIEMLELPIA